MAEMQTKYETEKKEQQISLLNLEKEKQAEVTAAETKKQRLVIYSISGGLMFMLLLALVIFKALQNNKKKNKIITLQKLIVEEKNRDITDSITYAKRIQQAILPSEKTINESLKDSYIFYKPKDIVAGDFYWLEKINDTVFIAAADCTGHGVPGAMVSVVCSNALNRAIKEFGLTEPSKILDKVRELVIETFEKSESEVRDGMDISLCAINNITHQVTWSGANNSL
jgi:hypothetical protein